MVYSIFHCSESRNLGINFVAIESLLHPQAADSEPQEYVVVNRPVEPWVDRALALLTCLALLLPLLVFGAQAIRLSGMGEESVGYRYFYSLRILYSPGDRPWLPQGQLAGLLHEIIQRLLSLLGRPLGEIYPRIEWFSYAAAAFPLLLAGPAFAWAIRPLRWRPGKFILAIAVVAISYEPRSGGGYHLVLPDYYTWILPTALIAIGWAFRALDAPPQEGIRRAVLLGLFAAACLSLKPTYVLLALLVGMVLLIRSATARDAFALCIIAPCIAVQMSYLLTLAYYAGDNKAALKHFHPEAFEGLARDSAANIGEWLEIALFGNPPDFTKVVLLWPLFLALCLLFLRRRFITLAVLSAALLSLVPAYTRFYPPTLIEVNAFGLVGMAIWMRAAGADLWDSISEWLRWQFPRRRIAVRRWVPALILVFAAVGAWRVWMFFFLFQPVYAASTNASRELDAFVSAHSGRTLFIVPDNNFRPTTVDSAIYKGGVVLYKDFWDRNAFVPGLFPQRDYIIRTGNEAIQPDRYDALVFVSLQGQEVATLSDLAERYSFPSELFTCPWRADLGLGPTNFFLPSISAGIRFRTMYAPIAPDLHRVLIGCVRKPIIQEQPAAAFEPAIYSQGDLFLPERDGLVRLTGTEGQTTTVTNLGSWNESEGGLEGLDATVGSSRWQFEPFPGDPMASEDLLALASPGSPTSFRLSHGGTPFLVRRLSDRTGTFLRIQALQPVLRAGIYAKHPLAALEGAPLTARAEMRLSPGHLAGLWVDDVRASGQAAVRYETRSNRTGEWVALQVQVRNTEFPDPADRIGLEIEGMRGGDYFDLRLMEASLGVRP